MITTTDHISEATKALIRNASVDQIAKIEQNRMIIVTTCIAILIVLSITVISLALFGHRDFFSLLLCSIILSFAIIERQNKNSATADIMKISLNPELITKIKE